MVKVSQDMWSQTVCWILITKVTVCVSGLLHFFKSCFQLKFSSFLKTFQRTWLQYFVKQRSRLWPAAKGIANSKKKILLDTPNLNGGHEKKLIFFKKCFFFLLSHQYQLTNLSERRPLSFWALVQVIIGVRVCVKNSSCAQLVHGIQTDSWCIPETHCSIFMPVKQTHTHYIVFCSLSCFCI